jgi:GT2 family glycosyltransferase
MSFPAVSIIILNWNRVADTMACVTSLLSLDYEKPAILIVDNASRGDDVSQLDRAFGKRIQLIRNPENFGFSRGNNIGIARALNSQFRDYILLLNNDTIAERSFLKTLVENAERERAALAGPKIFYADYNGAKDVIWFGGGRIRWPVYPGYHALNQFQTDRLSSDLVPREVDWVSGACLLINPRLIDPFLDEGYFFGCEDVEKSLRARRSGQRVIYVPTAVIWHKVGASRPLTQRQFVSIQRFVFRNNRLWPLLCPLYAIQAVKNRLFPRPSAPIQP